MVQAEMSFWRMQPTAHALWHPLRLQVRKWGPPAVPVCKWFSFSNACKVAQWDLGDGRAAVVVAAGEHHDLAATGTYSHASPYLSPSEFFWSALGTVGQLSTLQVTVNHRHIRLAGVGFFDLIGVSSSMAVQVPVALAPRLKPSGSCFPWTRNAHWHWQQRPLAAAPSRTPPVR